MRMNQSHQHHQEDEAHRPQRTHKRQYLQHRPANNLSAAMQRSPMMASREAPRWNQANGHAHAAATATETKSIPLPKDHVRRTESELQLCEDMAVAEQKDLNMFYRLINGIRDRQIALARGQDGACLRVAGAAAHGASRANGGGFGGSLHDQSIAGIIQTRNMPLNMSTVLETIPPDTYTHGHSHSHSHTYTSSNDSCSREPRPAALRQPRLQLQAAPPLSLQQPPCLSDVAPSRSTPKQQQQASFLPQPLDRMEGADQSTDDWSVSGFESAGNGLHHITNTISNDVGGNCPQSPSRRNMYDVVMASPAELEYEAYAAQQLQQQHPVSSIVTPPAYDEDDEIFDLDL
eukprot:CAMPEP_0119573374 /NCGR_PEP_ID=MMETSP1352-20130426/45093_1 /TAXON_ID=265584 /ORGANISM="Stauroneis constricta, Strain CCMP1120" /LENGTH=346 /DNA_ID=CAMNT_0007623063 /DNA_START=198 /DNA_END=1238 /DNA_ORIENTATION=+